MSEAPFFDPGAHVMACLCLCLCVCSHVHSRCQQLEDERLTITTQLATKKEEVLSLGRDLTAQREFVVMLDAKLVQRETEVANFKDLLMQLEVLYCIVLYCTVLYCAALTCPDLPWPVESDREGAASAVRDPRGGGAQRAHRSQRAADGGAGGLQQPHPRGREHAQPGAGGPPGGADRGHCAEGRGGGGVAQVPSLSLPTTPSPSR